jgi:hypothetical protein
VLVLTALYAIFRKRATSRHRETLLDSARARLQKLKTEAPELPPHAVAVRISLIIRQYLEAAFDDPALFETNEEFALRPHALARLHPDSRLPVADHLTELSQLKYSPHGETDHLTRLIDQAGEILANIELNVAPTDVSPATPTDPHGK